MTTEYSTCAKGCEGGALATQTDDLFCLDSKTFAMTESSQSGADASNLTFFHYCEKEGVVWGDFCGGVVSTGRMVGERVGETLKLTFTYRTDEGKLISGAATTQIGLTARGTMCLHETFIGIDGKEHTSYCEEYSE